jgi:HlyD family secretion protein
MFHESESEQMHQDRTFPSIHKRKILVIDDSLLMRKLLVDQLPSDRFEVYEAEDGETGLAKAQEINPDLILLDHVMPGMDGYEVFQALRGQLQFVNTPIIVMSGRYDEVVQKFGSPFGQYNFMPKQASRDQLQDRLNAVLPMTVSESHTEAETTSVNVAVQDIAAAMAHLGQVENPLVEEINENQAANYFSTPKSSFFRNQLPIILITAAISAVGAIFFYNFTGNRLEQRTAIATNKKALTPKNNLKSIAALGRLEPQGEITRLSAPNSLEGSRIEQLFVKEGDVVKAGQIVATLDSQTSRLAAWRQAQSQILTAQAELVKVKAGAKSGDINAQKANVIRLNAELNGGVATQEAEIARIEADLRNAQSENDRYQKLYAEGGISKSESDSKQLRLETVQNQLSAAQASLDRLVKTVKAQQNQAESTLDSVEEVRPVDIQVAQSEVQAAQIAAAKAKADLDLTYIRSPIDGIILDTHVRAGEVVGTQGIASIGRTDQMYVTAEVYETDIGKVRVGQTVNISSDALPYKLNGRVSQVGLQVKKQGIFDINPLSNTDYKVVEVKVRLDPPSSRKVAGFSNLQVQTAIQTNS